MPRSGRTKRAVVRPHPRRADCSLGQTTTNCSEAASEDSKKNGKELMLNKKIKDIPGVKDIGPESIDIKDINTDITRNKTRSKGMEEQHIEDLVAHMRENGIDETLPKPIVEKIPYEDRNLPENIGKQWYIVDGNHTIEAMRRIGYKNFKGHVVEFDNETAREDTQTIANNHPPALDADIPSVVNTLSMQISRGDLLNEKSKISEKVQFLCSGKKKQRDQIVAEVMKDNGTPKQWLNWTKENCCEFLMDNYDRTTEFAWDADREVYGAVMKQESEHRTIIRAISHFNEVAPNGRKYNRTDVVISLFEKGDETPTEKRQKMIDTTNKILDNILEATGADDWPNGCPIRFVGAMPQDLGSTYNENPKELILIDSDTDEILVH